MVKTTKQFLADVKKPQHLEIIHALQEIMADLVTHSKRSQPGLGWDGKKDLIIFAMQLNTKIT